MLSLQRWCVIAGIVGTFLIFVPLGEWWGYRHDADLLRVALLTLAWVAVCYGFWWSFEGRWKS